MSLFHKNYIDGTLKMNEASNVHHLKTWPEAYEAIESGLKPFEFRKNDRNYKVGDILVLRKYDPTKHKYLGPSMRVRVAYILDTDKYLQGLEKALVNTAGYVCMTIVPDPMKIVTYCPNCNAQHIDEDEWRFRLHKKHLCKACGAQWEPIKDTYTVGIAEK